MNAEPLLKKIARTFAEHRLLRSRASPVDFDGYELLIASLSDIIASKRAAGRGRDLAVLDVLERTLVEKKTPDNQKGPRGRLEKGE